MRRDQPAIVAAAARGAEVVGDIELFARELPPGQKVLAITGSNGKTTVTSLAAQLIERSGRTAVAAGNIGPTLLDTPAARPDAQALPQVWVGELSRFQPEGPTGFGPTPAPVPNPRGDRSFIDSAAAGAERAIKELGVSGKIIETAGEQEHDAAIRRAVQGKPNLIITIAVASDTID